MAKSNLSKKLIVQPIATLRESDGFVLGIARSGYGATPFATFIVRRTKDGSIRDYAHDCPYAEYGEPIVAWMAIPFEVDEVETAIAAGEQISKRTGPVLEGDPEDHLYDTRQIVFELAEAIGARRAVLKLHARLGDDIDGPHLPETSPPHLFSVRSTLTQWVKGEIDEDEVIENISIFFFK